MTSRKNPESNDSLSLYEGHAQDSEDSKSLYELLWDCPALPKTRAGSRVVRLARGFPRKVAMQSLDYFISDLRGRSKLCVPLGFSK